MTNAIVAEMPGTGLVPCRAPGADPEWWFPAPNDSEGEQRAVLLCSGCPVREACAELAVAHREPFGVWGGLTERDRGTLRLHECRRCTCLVPLTSLYCDDCRPRARTAAWRRYEGARTRARRGGAR